DSWLSQANHIFNLLEISTNFEDYAVLYSILFCVSTFPTRTNPPKGFLFLCPPKDFEGGQSSFKWPASPVLPAYWSLDPVGAEPINWEDAANLGFPSLQLSTKISGSAWDASVYAGVRQFHQAKGFDPDSQDIARHLGQPLYEV
ncbi:hypothetical protein DFH08DRAFT_1039626, partial [Mycena albidolilacea]